MQHLEEQIAYLTRTVDELNEIVTSQQSDIDLLKRRVQMLMEREAQREANDKAVSARLRPKAAVARFLATSARLTTKCQRVHGGSGA